MPFSNTTTKAGILQEIEFWTNLGDAGITGNATLLKTMTSRVNEAFNRLSPFLYSFSDYLKWDDSNNTDLPIGTFDIVSGQSDYTIAQDDNSLDILNITGMRVLTNSSSTYYYDLKEMTMDEWKAIESLSPNSYSTGIPTSYLKRGNTIFLYPQPNYNATNGAKIYFEREISYFVSTDTSKEPGIPRPFHALLALYAAHDWLLVNKPENGTLITRLEAQITKRESELQNAINGRFPRRAKISSAPIIFK